MISVEDTVRDAGFLAVHEQYTFLRGQGNDVMIALSL